MLNGNSIFWVYLVFVSASLALLEIQIEGGNGWAKGLPLGALRINGPER